MHLRPFLIPMLLLVAALVALAAVVRWLEPRFAFFPSAGEDTTPREFGVEYEVVSITTKDGERLRAWWMCPPSPKAFILYFHGNGGNLSVWTPILTGIVHRGYALLAFDYRGYGLSTGRPTEQGLYRDVEAAVGEFTSRASPQMPHVYWGRSLGVAMASYAATTNVPDALILESGFPSARSLLKGSPVMSILSLFSTYRFPSATFLDRRTTRTPVLILHGDADRIVPIELGRQLFEQLAQPKQFVAIHGGDHNDVAPRQSAAYWPAVETFIDRL